MRSRLSLLLGWLITSGLMASCGCQTERSGNDPSGSGGGDPWGQWKKRLVAKCKVPGFAYDMEYSPDGKTILISGTMDLEVRDSETLELVRRVRFPSGTGNPYELEVAADGGTIFVGDSYGKVYALELVTGAVRFTLDAHTNPDSPYLKAGISHMALSPDGKYLVTSSNSSEDGVKVWSLERRELVKALIEIHHGRSAYTLDGQLLFVSHRVKEDSFRSRVSAFYFPSFEPAGTFDMPEDQETYVGLVAMRKGELVFAAGTRGFYFWKRKDSSWELEWQGPMYPAPRGDSAVVHEPSQVFASCGSGVRIIDYPSKRVALAVPPHGSTSREASVRFSPDGRRLAYLTTAGACFVLDVEDLTGGK